MKIWVHSLIFNEENFVWFSLTSVIEYVDKILVWDTGSTDNTSKIIEEVVKKFPGKVDFKEVGRANGERVKEFRQKMLEESDCDFIIILDGDEIWPEQSIKKLTDFLKKEAKSVDAVVVPFYNLVGDIYHYQEESAGKYSILGRVGHQSIKAINTKIPGLHVDLPYPHEGFFDKDNKLIQERRRIIFKNYPFFHASLLGRSALRPVEKTKLEMGITFPKNFTLPKVFAKPYPKIVKSPWKKMSGFDLILGYLLTPIKNLKRRLNG